MARPISKTTKFILALPRDLPAKEVLSKAKASGFKTSESNVHRVRRLHGGAKKASHASKGSARVSLAKATHGSHPRTEELLRAVAAELGLGRALEILQGERSRVRAMLGT